MEKQASVILISPPRHVIRSVEENFTMVMNVHDKCKGTGCKAPQPGSVEGSKTEKALSPKCLFTNVNHLLRQIPSSLLYESFLLRTRLASEKIKEDVWKVCVSIPILMCSSISNSSGIGF